MSSGFKRKQITSTDVTAVKRTLKNAPPSLALAKNAASAIVMNTQPDLEIELPATMVIFQAERSAACFAANAHGRIGGNEKLMNVNTSAAPVAAVTTSKTTTTTSTGTTPLARPKAKRVASSCISKVSTIGQSAATGSARSSQNISAHFDADEVDTQQSDSDEDGYSNIDFYDDDYQIIESKECIDEYDPTWTQAFKHSGKVFNCDDRYQQSSTCPKSKIPISYFDLILRSKEDFFTKLAKSCNTRAPCTMRKVSNFHNFNSEDMQIFMGICLQMSSFRLFHLDHYWNENAHFGFRGFDDKMGIHRFKMILDALNFNMFKGTESVGKSCGNDRFSEVRPLLNYFNSRMETISNCDRRLILDEPLIYWNGKFNWLNEVNNKFHCNAVMLHFLTDPSGLVLRIVPDYENLERKQLTRNSKTLALQRLTIAMEALKPMLRKGRSVYTSKYYSSYALALELAKQQTYSNGFLDCNRFGNSRDLLLTPIDKGCAIARYAGDIMMAKYRHREKSFYFYSSNHLAEPSPTDVVKELQTLLYLPHDIRSKMFNSQILLPCAEIKWEKRLMIYVMNLFVLNAYILYIKHAIVRKDQVPIRYEKFRQEVIRSLLGKNLAKKHILHILPAINDKVVRKRCQICRKGGLMTYSKYSCKLCPGMPGLCETPCFKIWHDQLDKSTAATTIDAASQMT